MPIAQTDITPDLSLNLKVNSPSALVVAFKVSCTDTYGICYRCISGRDNLTCQFVVFLSRTCMSYQTTMVMQLQAFFYIFSYHSLSRLITICSRADTPMFRGKAVSSIVVWITNFKQKFHRVPFPSIVNTPTSPPSLSYLLFRLDG